MYLASCAPTAISYQINSLNTQDKLIQHSKYATYGSLIGKIIEPSVLECLKSS